MKTKTIFIMWTFLLAILSCNNKQKEIIPVANFLHITNHHVGITADTIDFIMHKKNINNTYYYSYTTKDSNTIHFDIDFETCEGLYYHNSTDTCELTFINKTEHILYPAQKCINIYVFREIVPNTADADFDFYFIPSFGLILQKSTTWHDFLQLYSFCNNPAQNDSLKLLIPLVYMELYYAKKSTFEPPPPSPSVKVFY